MQGSFGRVAEWPKPSGKLLRVKCNLKALIRVLIQPSKQGKLTPVLLQTFSSLCRITTEYTGNSFTLLILFYTEPFAEYSRPAWFIVCGSCSGVQMHSDVRIRFAVP